MKHTRKHLSKRGSGSRKQIGAKSSIKAKRVNQKEFDGLIKKMLELQILLKLYHWNTFSYATHKASGDLYDGLSDRIDEYAEVMMGKSDGKYRIDMSHFNKLIVKGVSNNNQLASTIKSFISELNTFHSQLPSNFYSEVQNIKDEIVADLDKFLYLLTLK